jgi:putative NIF3 family GTP cyclohydrolase 1 type 2
MSSEDKQFFDSNKLDNPFLDSQILVNDGTTKVKRILAGIDILSSEILLASQLSERGKTIDLVIAHHPQGKALAYLHEVMDMQTDIYEASGIPVHIAEKIIDERAREVERGLQRLNHYEPVRVAELLGVNFINTHTITDNLVNKFLTEYLDKKAPETIGELLRVLLELPEYQEAKRMGVGPMIISGNAKHRTGKILVEMTGGTNPSAKVYEELSHYGISTVVGMHMQDTSIQKSNEVLLNVVLAGHMSSDSLGMNLFLDELEKKGIDIVPCGGLIRVSRVKKGKK